MKTRLLFLFILTAALSMPLFAPPLPLRGKLVCLNGKPMAGCKLKASYKDKYGVVIEDTPALNSATNVDGQFVVVINSPGPNPSVTTVTSDCCPGQVWTFNNVQMPGDLGTLTCPQCGCAPPPSKLADWWTFDALTATAAADRAGLANNYAVYKNKPQILPGMVSNAMCLDGKTQFAEAKDHPEIDFNGVCPNAEPFSIDFWIKLTPPLQTTGVYTILDKREATPNGLTGWSVYLANGRVGFQMASGTGSLNCNTAGSACTNVTSSAFIADGEWHFVAILVSPRCGPTTFATFFIDGHNITPFKPRQGDLANSKPLWIGRGLTNAYLRGCIDELEIFKRRLNEDDLAAIYTAGPGGKCKKTEPD